MTCVRPCRHHCFLLFIDVFIKLFVQLIVLAVLSVLAKCCCFFFCFFDRIWCVDHKCDNIAISGFCQNSAWMQSWLLFYLFIYQLFKSFFYLNFDVLFCCLALVVLYLWSSKTAGLFFVFFYYYYLLVCWFSSLKCPKKTIKNQTDKQFWFVSSDAWRVFGSLIFSPVIFHCKAPQTHTGCVKLFLG